MPTMGESVRAASNPELPANQPFQDGETALENSLNELRGRDLEYQRLQTEESRQQWENAARANLAHQRELQQQRQGRIELDVTQRQALDDRHDEALMQQAMEVLASLPTDRPHTENTLPLDKLRTYAQVQQRLNEAVERRGDQGADLSQLPNSQPARPQTFEDGSTVQIKQNDDGTLEAKLITGEVFRGDPLTVTRKLGEAQVNTKRWGQSQRAAAQPQPPASNGSANPNSAVTFSPGGSPQVDFSKIPDVQRWQLDQMAVSLGYTDGQEMVADQIQARERTQRLEQELRDFRSQQEDWAIASSFMGSHPEFPATPEANEALTRIIDSRGLDYSLDNLEMAHALALQQRLYEPLTSGEQAIANGATPRMDRPVPPPMAPRGNPDLTHTSDPYTMSMNELRNQAIRQQLEGGR